HGRRASRRPMGRMERSGIELGSGGRPSGFEVEPRVQTFDAESGNHARPGTHFMRGFLLTDVAIAKRARQRDWLCRVSRPGIHHMASHVWILGFRLALVEPERYYSG